MIPRAFVRRVVSASFDGALWSCVLACGHHRRVWRWVGRHDAPKALRCRRCYRRRPVDPREHAAA